MFEHMKTMKRYITADDAITGNSLTFSVDHIAVFLEQRDNTMIVLPSGVAYKVVGDYHEILATAGIQLTEAE